MEIDIQWDSDLVGEERTDGLPADAADDLADQKAMGEPMVARRLADRGELDLSAPVAKYWSSAVE